jgi:hypothetical protein
MTVEVINARGLTEPVDIGRSGAGDFLEHRDAARDHVAVLEIADAQHAIDSLADQIDQPIALAHVEFDAGVFGEKVRQARHHEMTRERAMNIHAQQSFWFGVAKRGLGVLEIGDQ